MLCVMLQCPAGRYHATPWGRHVNEGEVEWPPSPWRLYRALLAAGFNRLAWTAIPPLAVELFESLARVLPEYHLPAATAAHTRHYMPQFKGSTSKVLDAFAYVGRGDHDALGISWNVDLSPEMLALFDSLLGALTYLGRAESWVDAQRVESIAEGLDRCTSSDSAPGPGFDRVALLAPLDPAAFAAWRDSAIEQEKHKRLANVEPSTGKKKSGLLKKGAEAITKMFPADIVSVLGADTATLQKRGWNQPPGTRWVAYWRRQDALSTLPAAHRAVVAERPAVDTMLLALSSNTSHSEVLPRFTESLWWLEKLHRALVKRSAESGRVSACLLGRDEDGDPMEGHRHVTLVPLSLDGKSRLDHVLLHSPMGFDDAAIGVLRRFRTLYGNERRNIPDLYVSLVGMGKRPDLATSARQLHSSKVWQSVTPFLPPRFLKPRGTNALEGQVRAELACRGFPNPLHIEIELEDGHAPIADAWALWRAGAPTVQLTEGAQMVSAMEPARRLSTSWRHFRRERFDHAKRPPVDAAFGLRLSFAEPIDGPIAIGYASHFGLGQFVPA